MENIFIVEYCGDIRKIVEDWPITTTDTSPTLALLDILATHLIYKLDGPLARIDDDVEFLARQCERLVLSVMGNDGEDTKSRSFTKWMLAMAQFIDVGGPHNVQSFENKLS